MSWRMQNREERTNAENHGHDGERPDGRDFDPVRQEHFGCDEGEQRSEAVVQVVEVIQEAGEREVERAQAEDGRDVGRVDDEGVARDGEHGGDGVYGEEQVSGFDGQDDEEQAALVFLELDDPAGERVGG